MAREQRSIDELLQTIPQEIYDRIYNETFTAPHKNITIKATYTMTPIGAAGHRRLHTHLCYTPPKFLSIDRASRKQFAASHYAKTRFVFHGSSHLLKLWYGSIDPAHKGMLGAVALQCSQETMALYRRGKARRLLSLYGEELIKVFRFATKDSKSGHWRYWRLAREGDEVGQN